jgi:hypothetical protein
MKNKATRITISSIIITLYLLLPFLFFQPSITMMDHSHHMMAESDCTYISSAKSVCPFDILYYLNAWKSIFFSSLLYSKILMLLVVLVLAIYTHLLYTHYDKLLLYSRRSKNKIKILYQLLFAQGLLNPKVF